MKALTAFANQQQEPKLPRERPILFSAEMVRAILDGRKTQTRRVLSPQPFPPLSGKYPPSDPFLCDDGVWRFMCGQVCYDHNDIRCPFGLVGDRLWVRETFIVGYPSGVAGAWSVIVPSGVRHQQERRAFYRADGNDPPDEAQRPWRSPIHMPRWASRIALEITAVRVQPVQDIGGLDAIAEGIERSGEYYLGGPHRRVEGKTKVFTLAWQAYKRPLEQPQRKARLRMGKRIRGSG